MQKKREIIEYMQNRTCFCTNNTCCLAFHRDILFFQLLGRRIEFLADRIDFITDNLAQIQKRGLGTTVTLVPGTVQSLSLVDSC